MSRVAAEALPMGVLGAAIGMVIGFGLWHLLWWRSRGRKIWNDGERLRAAAARESTRADDLSSKVDYLTSEKVRLEAELELRDIERRRLLQAHSQPRAVAELEDETGRAHRIEIHLAEDDARIEVRSELQEVEGIGPLIAELLTGAGITSLAELGTADPESINQILTGAGPGFRMHDPSTWPEQARRLNGAGHRTHH